MRKVKVTAYMDPTDGDDPDLQTQTGLTPEDYDQVLSAVAGIGLNDTTVEVVEV